MWGLKSAGFRPDAPGNAKRWSEVFVVYSRTYFRARRLRSVNREICVSMCSDSVLPRHAKDSLPIRLDDGFYRNHPSLRLRVVRIGRQLRFTRHAIEEFIQRNESKGEWE